MISLVVIAVLSLALVGCPWRAEYLRDSVNRATADEVSAKMGAPALVRGLDSGGEVWTYRYNSRDGCVEYIVKFDGGKILRDWSRHGC